MATYLAVVVLAGTVGTVAYALNQLRWHRALVRDKINHAVDLLAHGAQLQWDDPTAVENLARQVAQQFGVQIALTDSSGNVLFESASADFTTQYRVWIEQVLRTGSHYPPRTADSSTSDLVVAAPVVRNGQVVGVAVSGAWPVSGRTFVPTIYAGAWMVFLVVIVASGGLAVWYHLRPLEDLARAASRVQQDGDDLTVAAQRPQELAAIRDALVALQQDRRLEVQQLREHSELYAGVLHQMAEGVLAVGRDDRLYLANEASGRMLGFAAAQAVGKPLVEVLRCRPLEELIRITREKRRPQRSEFPAPGISDRRLSAWSSLLTGFHTDTVLVVLHDVTELHRLENLRKEFVANVSHELKTPLATIAAYAETLRLGALEDPDFRLKCVTRIEEQANRLHQMIVELLQLARIESGQQAFEFTDVPVKVAVQECIDAFQELARNKQLDLALDEGCPDVSVHADREGVRTILNNLLDNAIKYTPVGGRIRVRWTLEGGYVVIAVADTGIGIALKDQARVFERFYRTDRARSRQSGGTGLGLAIVKHVCHAMGGDVSVESREGVGSTFYVRLPVSATSSAQVGTGLSSGDSFLKS